MIPLLIGAAGAARALGTVALAAWRVGAPVAGNAMAKALPHTPTAMMVGASGVQLYATNKNIKHQEETALRNMEMQLATSYGQQQLALNSAIMRNVKEAFGAQNGMGSLSSIS